MLQGGGALGAYEWGAIEALFAVMDEVDQPELSGSLRSVTGVSIGAINGGLHRRRNRIARMASSGCERFWDTISMRLLYSRVDFGWLGLPSSRRARSVAVRLPGFYLPRSDFSDFRALDQPLQHGAV